MKSSASSSATKSGVGALLTESLANSAGCSVTAYEPLDQLRFMRNLYRRFQRLPLKRSLVMRKFSMPAIATLAAALSLDAAATPARVSSSTDVHFQTVRVDGVNLFYREAGPANAPVVLLLHGFPTSSHMYRNLIPLLADRYRVIAPDLPG